MSQADTIHTIHPLNKMKIHSFTHKNPCKIELHLSLIKFWVSRDQAIIISTFHAALCCHICCCIHGKCDFSNMLYNFIINLFLLIRILSPRINWCWFLCSGDAHNLFKNLKEAKKMKKMKKLENMLASVHLYILYSFISQY